MLLTGSRASMLLGPVLTYELVASSRRLRSFILRGAYGAVLLLIFWAVYSDNTGGQPLRDAPRVAHTFFLAFAYTQLAAAVLVTPAYFAGAITMEKERRTLDYLLTTDLRVWEIVLSRWLGRFTQVIVLICIGLPIFALGRLLGGIDQGQMIFAFAVTISSAIAISAVALFCSVIARRTRDAILLAYVVLSVSLILSLILPLFGWMTWIRRAASPFYAFYLGLNLDPLPAETLFADLLLTQVAVHLGSSLLLLAASGLMLRQVYLRQSHARPRSLPFLSRWWGRPAVRDDPVGWKEVWVEGFGATCRPLQLPLLLLWVGTVGPTGYYAWKAAGTTQLSDFAGAELNMALRSVIALGGSMVLLLMSGRAAACITGEKERLTWDTLLSTPLPAESIVLGKLVGLFAGSIPYLAPLLLCMLMAVPAGAISIGGFMAVCVELAIYGLSACALGLIFSLHSKNSGRAMLWTLSIAFVAGGGYLMCCIFLVGAGPAARVDLAQGGFIPFILFATVEPSWESNTFYMEHAAVAGAVLVMLAHVCAAGVLLGVSISHFDQVTNRAAGWSAGQMRQRPG